MYYILKDRTKPSRVYHLSDKCPMVRVYRDSYEQVSKPPAGYRACRRSGACQA